MVDRQQAFDPLKALRDLLDRGERRINEILSECSAGEGANALRSRLSELSLDAQKRSWEFWARYFQSINLPTRTDIIELGKRVSEVEDGVARIEAQLRSLSERMPSPGERAATAARSKSGTGPRRTRRPPGEAQAERQERQ